MEKPTLEEVKEHFENAKEVVCVSNGRTWDITKDVLRGIHEWNNGFWIDLKQNNCKVWNEEKGFAKILTTKKPTYSITADQLMQLENGFTLPKLKEWFPEVFVKKLEVGKWYRNETPCLFFCTGLNSKNQPLGYGFSESWRWLEDSSDEWDNEGIKEATEQEVFEALKNELVKRGINFSDRLRFVKDENCMIDGDIGEGGLKLFRNGVFIPTKTRKQVEQELNCKIID